MQSLVTFDGPVDEDSSPHHTPGQPLASRICETLAAEGIKTRAPRPRETYAWSWYCTLGRTELFVVLGFRDDANGRWLLSFMPRFKLGSTIQEMIDAWRTHRTGFFRDAHQPSGTRQCYRRSLDRDGLTNFAKRRAIYWLNPDGSEVHLEVVSSGE